MPNDEYRMELMLAAKSRPPYPVLAPPDDPDRQYDEWADYQQFLKDTEELEDE